MSRKILLVTLFTLIIFLAACADQGPAVTEVTGLPPEPESGVAEEPSAGPTPTESPDSPVPAEAGRP